MIGRWCGTTPAIVVEIVQRDAPLVDARRQWLTAIHRATRRTRSGKPYLAGVGSFSVSDTETCTAYAFADRKYVGIDLEAYDRPDLRNISRRLGHVVAGSDEVVVDFLTRWVVKEACLKALGLGLWPWIRNVRLLSRTAMEASVSMGTFEAQVGRIPMRAITISLGQNLLGIAVPRHNDGGEIRVHHGDAILAIGSARPDLRDQRVHRVALTGTTGSNIQVFLPPRRGDVLSA
ncbi:MULTISPECIES: 4'-phosphopantetheinyl transferase superfamily protein [unclassified Bradyrhizobium]|uniref:4'-phosphopantetheinyl transferase family protein n=1 Tax=unclassified Bradyrhizobium TaxID=2631580 RepID=UPI0028E3C2F2|nr:MULTISPECIES: 4'-phosphopantetheinyl transferase superfamily protein [unclassified Bradyrhizobium]